MDVERLAYLLFAAAAATALCCIADRLCEIEPRVIVQVMPITEAPPVESAGDRAATGGE